MLSREKFCMFKQIFVSTGTRWMTASLAFSIYVVSSLKHTPGLSYPVHSLCQPSHCHNSSHACLIVRVKEDVSVAIETFPNCQGDSGEGRTNRL